MATRVVLYTRQGCHLCDDARAVVAQVCESLGQEWVQCDVDADKALRERFGDEVPVVTVDGEVVGFWRIDPDLLHQALA